MKKILLILTAITLLCVTAVFSSMLLAADTVIYVNQSEGADTNSGTAPGSALKTIDAGFKKLSGGGVLVIVGNYDYTANYEAPKCTGKVTITSVHGGTDYKGTINFKSEYLLKLNGETSFRDIKFAGAKALIAAQFNAMSFDEGFSNTNQIDLFGGHYAPTGSLPVNLDSHITINSGNFRLIVGFTRKKGDASRTYTGTSHITVNGGIVGDIRGASVENHYSGSTVITVNGGSVSSINTGGDVTRRISNTATVNLNGGNVGLVSFNNVVKGGELNINKTAPDSVKVTYANDTIKELADKAKCKFTVNYDSLLCSANVIKQFKQYFDVVNNTTTLYVSSNGNGDGSSESTAMGSFAEAYKKLASDGGKIVVLGSVNGNLSKSGLQYGGLITVVGKDSSSTLNLTSSNIVLESDTLFKSIKLKASSSVTLNAQYRDLTVESSVTTEGSISVNGSGTGSGDASITLNGGSFKNVVGIDSSAGTASGNVNITVNGATVDYVTLSRNSKATVSTGTLNLSGGYIKSSVFAEKGSVSSSSIQLLGGKMGALTLKGCNSPIVLNLANVTLESNIKADGISKNASGRTLLVGDGVDSSKLKDIKAYFGEAQSSNFIYVRDGGTGTGASPDSPLSDLKTAIEKLGSDGTVVICGTYNISSNLTISAHSYVVTITSVGPDTDYRKSGAKIILNANLYLGGTTTFKDVNFDVPKSVAIVANANKLTIADNVESTLTNANTNYINIYGGKTGTAASVKTDVTVNSGDWGILRAGGNNTSTTESGISINLTVNGGTFYRYVALASRGRVSGTINFTANGGKFLQSVYAVYEEDGKAYSANYDVNITINGGEFHQEIAPAYSKKTTVNGSFDVVIHGGEFSHLTDLVGAEEFAGNMTSSLKTSDKINIKEKETGTTSFTNALRKNADPWLFYYDGFYYYTYTAGTNISLLKVANLADIKTATPKVICDPVTGVNMWSPEIHYFSAEEIGAENAGWYLFVGYDDGSTENQRAHVLKCLDGDNLMGRWGNPITGEVNVPQKIAFPDAPSYNRDALCGGVSKIVIGGKTYVTFVSEVGRGTQDFYQTINITAIKNPWTFVGVPTTICVPEYPWEMGGAGTSTTENKTWPKVVEGASAVYSDTGEVYLMYTGSGYWTTQYQLSYMTYLGGDPLNANSWKKLGKPILSLSDEVNGCGHGSYFKDHDGNYWVCYHGYLGKDTQSKRYSHLERIYVTADGVKIGNGSGHPAPIATVYTYNVNPLPLEEKIWGFGTLSIAPPSDDPQTPPDNPVTPPDDPVTPPDDPVTPPDTDPATPPDTTPDTDSTTTSDSSQTTDSGAGSGEVSEPAGTEKAGDDTEGKSEEKDENSSSVIIIISVIAVVAVAASAVIVFFFKKKSNIK